MFKAVPRDPISKFHPVSGFKLVFICPSGSRVSFSEIGEKPWLILEKIVMCFEIKYEIPSFGDTIFLNLKSPDWFGVWSETGKLSSKS